MGSKGLSIGGLCGARCGILCGILCALSMPGHGQAPPAGPSPIGPIAPIASIAPISPLDASAPALVELPSLPAVPAVPPAQALESTRRNVRSSAEWLARRVDSWFGDKPFEQGGKVSDGRLSLAVFKRQDQQADVDVRFNAEFRLPNVERFAYVFVGRDDRRDTVRDTPDDLVDQQRLRTSGPLDRSFLAGLGLTVFDAVDFRLGFGSRLKPYLQARITLPWQLAPGHVLQFRETFFWTQADRAGATTALAYDWTLAPGMALRWSSAATVTQESRNLEWSSSLALSRVLPGRQLLTLEALGSGEGTRGTGVGRSDVGLLTHWEVPLYRNWLFGEVVFGHFWPRPDRHSERGRAWALGGTLKLRF